MALRSLVKVCVKRRSVVTSLALFTLSVALINTIPLFPNTTVAPPPQGLKVNLNQRSLEKRGTPERNHRPPPPLPISGHGGAWKRENGQNDAADLAMFMSHNKKRRDKIPSNLVHVESQLKLKRKTEFSSEKKKGRPLSKGQASANSFHPTSSENKLLFVENKATFFIKHQPLTFSMKTTSVSHQPAGTPDTNPKGAGHHREKHTHDGSHGNMTVAEPEATQQNDREVSGEETAHEGNLKGSSTPWKRPHPLDGKESIPREQILDRQSDMCNMPSDEDTWSKTTLESLPWLSKDDVSKMAFLSGSKVLSKARLPGHGQVLQVALGSGEAVGPQDEHHKQSCQSGSCALIKRPADWFEVLAFHLDRVLGLNRSLPSVLRSFQSTLLPYRYTSGTARPVVWWDPGIHHLDEVDNDQNSVSLNWPRYQKGLRSRCGLEASLNATPCVGVHHSEWGRLALFDFLLQVNDRLDRYCCGFRPDPSDICVENMLHVKCQSPKDLLLVHILVRKAEPSKLVFIDNAGRPNQPLDNLNFRLVEGIDEFPERAVSVLRSGCLESMLLRSLSADRELWSSRGGAEGLRPIVHTIQRRGTILLQHMQNRRLRLNKDL
ncbi:Golgi-associated kinase 1A [Engraulis encrasicolus]|uniref:Golgi-associated kinase 1A n=1 Tax=Engraulis encrasicolus TaxID=184585 RepID=UPI002FD06F0E